MNTCIRGCTSRGKHEPVCTHTAECPDTCSAHCDGCAPRTAATGQLCRPCVDNLRDNLIQIPDLTAITEAMPGGRLVSRAKDHQTSDRRATKVDQLSLSPAFDEADEAMAWAYQWALVLADQQHHTGPFRYRNDGVPGTWFTTTYIGYLTNNIDQVAASDWVTDLYDEARALVRKLTHATGRDRLIHRIKERCPSCDQRALTRDDGAGKVVCNNENCNRIWTEDEYAHLAHVAVS